MLRVTQPLPINGCFSGSKILAFSRYSTILLSQFYASERYKQGFCCCKAAQPERRHEGFVSLPFKHE
jgi:hypothetical protein